MMRNYCLGFLLSLSVLLSSCAVVENGSCSGSSLRVALPGDGGRAASYTQDDIVKYEITITDEAGESRQQEGRPGGTVIFEHLAIGVYTVTVFAFDSSGYTGASGSEKAVVTKGKTCEVIILADLLFRSDFFISGEDGVQLDNHSEYILDSHFNDYRNDVDFSVGEETVAGEPVLATSVRLKNPAIPYVYVNAKNKTKMSAVMTDNNDVQSIRFYAKATEPSTVNFFFQDALHETHGIVLQQELTNEFPKTPYHIDFSKTKRFNNVNSGTWEGMFRAVVTSGNGTVTIQMADDTTPGTPRDLIHQVTIDPPNASAVKVSFVSDDTSTTDIARFEFTDTDCRAGFTGLCLENSYVLNGRVINKEGAYVNGVDVGMSLSSTLAAEEKFIQTSQSSANGLFFYTADYNKGSTNGTLSAIIEKTSADGSDFGTLLLKPHEPCIIEITEIGAEEARN